MSPTGKITTENGKTLIAARIAAKRLSCAQDYIGKLCREGKIEGKQVSGAWFVDEVSLVAFEKERTLAKAKRSELLAEERKKEAEAYRKLHGIPEPALLQSKIIVPSHVTETKKAFFNRVPRNAVLAVGGAALCMLVVFAGAASYKNYHAPASSQLTSALGHIESPFFGSNPMSVSTSEYPNSLAGNFISRIIALLFGNKNGTIAQDLKPVLVPTTPLATSTSSQTIVNNTYPVVERVVERAIPANGNFVTHEVLALMLSNLQQSIRDDVANQFGTMLNLDFFSSSNSGGGGLSLSDLTDANIPDTITASNYLQLAGGTLVGALTGTDALFTSATSTNLSTTIASTTSLVISGAGGSGTRCLQVSSTGVVSANASGCGGAGGSPGGNDTEVQYNDGGSFAGNTAFTFNETTGTLTVTNALTTSATSTNTFASRLSANSLAVGSTATTSISSAGVVTLAGLTSTGLAVNASGQIYGAATTTYSAPLVYTNGDVTITQATGAQNGYLSSIDWTTFNNKVASSSLGALFPFTQTTFNGTNANATSTLIGFTSGIYTTNASTTNLSANTAAFGATGTTSISSTGSLTIQALNGILKATNGLVSVATAGTDYANFAWPFTPTALGNSTSTLLQLTAGFISNASSTITALNAVDFLTTNATTTNFAATGTASTTALVVSSLGSAAGQCLTINSSGAVTTVSCSSGAAFPFTPTAWGNSTSTTIGFTNGLISNASSTFTATLFLSSLTNSGLAVNSAGQVYAAATTTFASPLTYSNGVATIQVSNGSQNGYLSSTDWSTFNNKISSTSLSAGSGIAYNSSTGVISNTIGFPFTPTALGNSTSTLLQLTAGFISNASSTITALNTINATSTNATSTNLAVSSAFTFGGVVGTAWSDFCQSITGGAGLCDGTDSVGSGGEGLATSTDIADTWVIYGTSVADVAGEAEFTYEDLTDILTVINASTTNLSARTASFGGTATTSISSAGVLTLAGLSNSGLAVNSAGQIYAAATTTYGSGLNYSNGVVTAAAQFPFTPTTNYGAIANATSTAMWFQNGLQASTTARFESLTAGYATTTFASTTVLSANTICLSTDCRSSWPSAGGTTFGQAWEIVNGSYLAPTSTIRGIIAAASSTIGDGSQTGGLTISGGATTTGSALIQGSLTVNGALTLGTDLAVAQGGTGVSTFGGTNTVLYTTAADTLASENAFTYDQSVNRLTFDFASTTAITATTASSTNLIVSALNAANCDVKASATGVLTCGTDENNSFSFTPNTWGNSTSTTIGFTNGLISNASSTFSSTLFLTSLTNSGLGVNTSGQVYAAPTTTYSGSLVYLNGNVTAQDGQADGNTKGVVSFTASDFNSSIGNISIDYTNGQAASASTKGFLTAADWTFFNEKVSSSSLSAALNVIFPFTPTTAFGSAANATTTLIGFTNGIYALASSTIGGGTQTSGLTISGGATTTGFLTVQGNSTSTFSAGVTASVFNATSQTASSTFANGINLTGGCFAINGGCLGQGAATAGGSNTQVQFNNAGTLAGDSSFTFNSSAARLSVSFASTTGISNTGTASTTNLTISGVLSGLLTTNSTGGVTSATVNSPLSFSNNQLSIQQANSSQSGYLSNTDWSVFNNKISSTSLSGASVISYNSGTGVISTQGGTFGSGDYVFPGNVDIQGNSTTTHATSSSMHVSGTFSGANLSSCSSNADKLLWSSATQQFLCGTDQSGGGGGNEINWTWFNGSGVRPSTTTNQVLIGHTSTSTLAKLEVVGGAQFDSATSTAFSVSGIAYISGTLGLGTTSPSAKLAISGGNLLHVAGGDPTLESTITLGGESYGSFVVGNIAYVAANTGGLKIVDVANPSAPALLSTYTTNMVTARDVVVAGDVAYIADADTGLHILDVSNPTSPTLIGRYALTGQVYSLALSGKYVFIVDFNNAAVRIVDVSDATKPVLAGSIIGTNPNAVTVAGKYAYVADFAPAVNIYDISNPASPALVGTYTTNVDAPNDIYISGRLMYIADGGTGLHVVNVANPASPAQLNRYDPGGTASYYGVQVAGDYAYLAEHGTGELVVVDISSSAATTLVGSYSSGTNPPSVFVSGKYAYLPSETTTFSITDINGAIFPAAHIGALESSNINVTEDLYVGGDIYTNGGLDVGISGIFSRGTIAAYIASTTQVNPVVATFMGGNVGVGTTSPYARLSVVGQVVGTYFTATSTTQASTFPFASTTALTVEGTASTTALVISGLNAANCDLKASGTGVITCGTDNTGTGFPFTQTTFNGTNANATSTLIGFTNGLYTTNASTTNISANTLAVGATATTSISGTGTLTLAGLTNSGLAVNSAGQVYAAATTTFGSGLTYANGNVTANFPFTQTTYGGTNANATSTLIGFTNGIYSTASSTINLLTTVNSTSTNATTTNFAISGISSGNLLKTTTGGSITSAVAGVDYATPSQVGGAFPFTPAAWGNSTSTTIGFTNGIIANASSTFSSTLFLTSLSNSGLAVNSAGQVYAAATTTFSGGLSYANGNVTDVITAGDGLTRTTNDIDCDIANSSTFGCLASADWTTFNNKISSSSLSQIFPFTPTALGNSTSTLIQFTAGLIANASSTITALNSINSTSTNATSTNFAITGIVSSLLKTNADGSVRAAVAGVDYAAGNVAFPFTQTTFNGTNANATSTLIGFTAGLYTTNASTTNISANTFAVGATATTSISGTGTLTLAGLTNSGLAVNSAGQVYAAATTTFGSGLAYANGNVTNTLTAGDGLTRTVDDIDCDTANSTTFGCLASADWTTFNNKISSSSLSQIFPFTPTTAFGSAANATSTLIGFTNGLYATASSTIVDGVSSFSLSSSGGITANYNGYELFLGGNSHLMLGGAAPYVESTDENSVLNLRSTGANGGVALVTNGIERLRASGNGNIGIGSTTPTYKLSVEGESSLGNIARAGYFIATSSTASVFPFASTTALSGTISQFSTASSTNLWISGIATGNLLKTTTGGQVTGAVAGTDYATPSQVTGAYPFPLPGNATSSLVRFNGGASTTDLSANTLAVGATATTSISGTGTLTLAGLTNSGLAVNSAGQVYAAATTTFSGALTYANGNVTCNTASGSQAGCLSTTDWTTFNNKISSSSLSQIFPFTPSSYNGTAVNATSTALQLTGGLFASSTVRFGNAATPNFVFDSGAGNLGVGTTTPFTTLSVQRNYGAATTTVFAVASSTAANGSTATTLFSVGSTGSTTLAGISSQLLKVNSGGTIIGAIAGVDYALGNVAFPFTQTTYGGTNANATSTLIGFTNGIYSTASSTINSLTTVFSTSTHATTSNLAITGLSNSGLAVNSAGKVYAAATTTYSGALTYANGAVTCNTASGSQAGCLSTTDWTTFNNKVSSSSLTAIFPFTPTTAFGTAANATSTLIGFTAGLYSTASSTFSSGLNTSQIGFIATTSTSTLATFGGKSLLVASTTGSNTGLGLSALSNLINGFGNTAFGELALKNATSSRNNVAIGDSVLTAIIAGNLTFQLIDGSAGSITVAGSDNAGVGSGALAANTYGAENVALGSAALAQNTTGIRNTAIGKDALAAAVAADANTAVGYASLATANTRSEGNTALGYRSLNALDFGSGQTAVGFEALAGSFTVSSSTAVGFEAGTAGGGYGETFVGYRAGLSATGGNNVLLGYLAGSTITSGFSNIVVGATSVDSNLTNGRGNILIGNNTFATSSNSVNGLNIGNLIYGTLPATTTSLSQGPASGVGINLGIGTTSPWAKFSINNFNGGSTPLFTIASSTGTGATSTLFQIGATGSTTLASTFGACSGSSALTTNSAGTIVCGALSATGDGVGTWFTPTALGNSTSTLIQFTAGLISSASSTIGSGAQAGGLVISGGATTTGKAYFADRVGIGTQAPDRSLKVVGTGADTIIQVEETAATNIAAFWLRRGNDDAAFEFNSADLLKIYADPGDNVDISINASDQTNQLYLDNAGNVGVGTTTPYAKLTIGNHNGGNTPLFTIASSTGTGATSTVFSIGPTGSTTLASTFGTCSGSNALTTNSSGTIVCGAVTTTGDGVGTWFTPTSVFGSAANATSTLIGFTAGLYSTASSTIGAGTQGGGLTILGGATTTANAYFGGLIGVGAQVTNGEDIMALQHASRGYLSIYRTSGASAGVKITAGSSNPSYVYQQDSSNDLRLYVNGADRVFIDDTGNVGVGTTTDPYGKFSITNFNGGTTPLFVIASSTGSSATSTPFIVTNTGDVGINSTGVTSAKLDVRTSGAGNVAMRLIADSFETAFRLSENSTFSNIDFTAISGGSLRVDNSGYTVFNNTGNVGLGSTTPTAKLGVLKNYGNTASTVFEVASSTASNGSTGVTLFSVGSTGNVRISSLTAANCDVKADTSGLLSCGTDATGEGGGAFPFTQTTYGSTNANATSTLIGFTAGLYSNASSTIGGGTAGTGLTISGGATTTGNLVVNGYIGIGGVQNPSSAVDIFGSHITVSNTGVAYLGSDAGRNLELKGAGTNSYIDLADTTSEDYDFRLSQSSNFLFLTSSTTADILTITADGKVGIGTTSPYAKLSVVGPVVAEYFHATSTTATSTFAGGLDVGGGALVYDYSGGLTTIQNVAFGSLNFDTDAGVVSWVDLPISSSAPANTVQSYSAQIDSLPLLTVYALADGVGTWRKPGVVIGTSTPTGTFTVMNATTTNPVIANFATYASSTVLTINENGRVGVGTTTPYSRLSVWGIDTSANTRGFEIIDSASTTLFSVTNAGTASTTALVVSGLNAADCDVKASATGVLSCGTDAQGQGGGTFPFTPTTAFGSAANATSTLIGFTAGIYSTASSTFTSGLNTSQIGFIATTSTSTLATFGGRSFIIASTTAANTGFGLDTLTTITSGSLNTAFGYGALSGQGAVPTVALTGRSNIGVGYLAGYGITSGSGNIGIGDETLGGYSGGTGVTGSGNIGVGFQANAYVYLGSNNIGIGSTTLYGLESSNAASNDNVGIGEAATKGCDSGIFTGNIGIGKNTLGCLSLSADSYNVAVGYNTLPNFRTGGKNVALGAYAGQNISSSVNGNNILIGYNALAKSATASNSLNIGNLIFADLPTVVATTTTSLRLPTTGKFGVATSTPFAKFSIHANDGSVDQTLFAIGSSTAAATTTLFAVNNVGTIHLNTNFNSTTTLVTLGGERFITASSTYADLSIGSGALSSYIGSPSTGGNTAVGQYAINVLTAGYQNTAVGAYALNAINNEGGDVNDNVAVGYCSGCSLTGSSNFNTALGSSALSTATSTAANTAVGYQALSNFRVVTITSGHNVALGYQALKGNSSNSYGTQNVGLGSEAGLAISTGGRNTFVGYSAGRLVTSGDHNVFLGREAGRTVTTGYSNILLGSHVLTTSVITTGAGNVGLGNELWFPSATADSQLNIGNLVFGTLPATSSAAVNALYPTTGAVGIATSSPFATFGIHANNGSLNKTLFAIGSSTASATTTLFSVSNTGAINAASGAFTVDSSGNITVTSCAGCGGGGAAFPFDPGSFGGTAVNATTTALQLTGGLFASSTIRFGSAGVSNLIFDSSTGRMGIGTTTPTAALGVQKAYGANGNLLFAIASSTNAAGSTAVNFFSVDANGTTTIGHANGTGDATFQFARDTNAWSMGYYSVDKTFRIASSTNLGSNALFQIGKAGTTTLNSGLGTGTGGNYLCINTTTFEVLRGNGSSCTASSGRYKDNVANLNYGLEDVMNLRAVSFTYKPEMNSGTSTHLGFIAEEVEQIIPELVTYNNDGSVQGLDYPTVTSVLVRAIQDLNLNVLSLSSTTIASTTDESMATSTRSAINFANGFWSNLFAKAATWLADAGNGIANLFATTITAETVYAKQLCLTDSSGQTCVTKAQLDALLNGSSAPAYTPPVEETPSGDTGTTTDNGGGTTEVPPVEETPVEEPPVEETPAEEPPAEEPTPEPAPEPTPEPTPEPAPAE